MKNDDHRENTTDPEGTGPANFEPTQAAGAAKALAPGAALNVVLKWNHIGIILE